MSQAMSMNVTDDPDRRWMVRTGLAATAVTLTFCVVFWQFFYNQIRHAINNPSDWGHTLLIPFMAGYLVYLNREKLAKVQFRIAWIGLLPVILGVAWYILCWVGPPAIRHHNLQGMGFGLALIGIVLLFFGFSAMRYLLFPIVYWLAFGIYISDRFMSIVTNKMQDIAAWGSYYLLNIIQISTERTGNVLIIISGGEEHPLNIAEACSGMRMLVAMMALGVFMAYVGLPYLWQRISVVILAVPVAIFVNILRVVTLGVMTLYNTDFAAGDFHTFIGLVWLVPALIMFLGLMWVLQRMVLEGEASEPYVPDNRPLSAKYPFPRHVRVAVLVVCATLTVSGLGFHGAVKALNIHLMKKPVELQRGFAYIPRQLGQWERWGEDLQLEKTIVEVLGTNDYLNRKYAIGGNPANGWIDFHVAYYTGMVDAVPHVPERCLTATGGMVIETRARHIDMAIGQENWRIDDGPPNTATGEPYRLFEGHDRHTRREYTVRMPVGDIVLRLWAFQDPRRPDLRQLSGYFFIANGRSTARAEEVRQLAFDRTDQYAYYAKIEFSMIGGRELDEALFTEQVSDLLKDLLPEIMRCLPDWAEIESRQRRSGDPVTPPHTEE